VTRISRSTTFSGNQLSGHERGATESGKLYAKDAVPDALHTHVDRLTFQLPAIEPFDIEDGLLAIRDALARKVGAA
jgi:hypothetical protein